MSLSLPARLSFLLLLGVASTLLASEVTLTVGFHNRGADHWAGYIDAACIGTDGYQNPLNDGTELLPSTDTTLVTSDQSQDTTQLTARWQFGGAVTVVTVEDWWDVRGSIEVRLYDTYGSLLATLGGPDDFYYAATNDNAVAYAEATGHVAALTPTGNAGGYVILTCTQVNVALSIPDEDLQVGTVDGILETPVTITVDPLSFFYEVGLVDVVADGLDGNGAENPDKAGLTFTRRDDRTFLIDNNRFYDDGTESCHKICKWYLRGHWRFFALDDAATTWETEIKPYWVNLIPHFRSQYLAASPPNYAQRGHFVWGKQGSLRTVTIVWDSASVTFNPGMVDIPSDVPASSQYMPYLVAEENEHQNQFEGNPIHVALSGGYSVAKLTEYSAPYVPMVGPNKAVLRPLINDLYTATYEDLRIDFELDIVDETSELRCSIEHDAKAVADSPYPLNLECAYPGCGGSGSSN